MLDQLLGEILALIGQGVVFYFACLVILKPLLWLVDVANRPLARLDRWLKSTAPQRTYTMRDHLIGQAVLWSFVGIIGLVLRATVGLH